MPLRLLLIFLGGGTGAITRYVIGLALGPHTPDVPRFPTATVTINVTGCLLIGFLATILKPGAPWEIREDLRLALIVGILGGYTTFSTFGRETFALLESHNYALALANILASNIAGLAAVWLGDWVASFLGSPPLRGGS